MSRESGDQRCLACDAGPDDAPLIALEYRQSRFWICPRHLPVLIHDPKQLIGKLPDAEKLSPADIHD